MTFLNVLVNVPIFACFHKDFKLIHIVSKRHLDGPLANTISIRFANAFSEINWSNRFNGLDVNNSYDIFINEYTKIFEACFPMERIKCKSLQNCNSPWITKGLLKSISKKIGFISN
jgi:hypothetical protein